MKDRIFRSNFLIYAMVVVIAGFFAEVYITSTVRENYIRNLNEHLSDKISLIAKSVPFNNTNLDDFCRELKKDIHARVTIILKDGRVVGDSDEDSTWMDNHANRPEIQQAAHLGTGMAIRFSDTLKYDFIYIAGKITREGTDEGFIRLAVPLKDVDNAVNHLRVRIILCNAYCSARDMGFFGLADRALKKITEADHGFLTVIIQGGHRQKTFFEQRR